MAKIIFHLSIANERTADLQNGEALTVGRGEDNAVQLDHPSISRRHARVRPGGEGTWLIEDLQSANGTAVNGAPVNEPVALHDGDRLRLGPITAVFYDVDEDAEQPTALPTPRIDTVAQRYRIKTALDETAEFRNFQAEDLVEEKRLVSLKVFNPGIIADAEGFAQAAAAFARITGAPGHPNLVRLLDFDRWRGAAHLASEWIDGYPLLDLLRRRGALAVADMAPLARQAAMTADHAQAHGLPAPELDPRSALLSFDEPMAAREWLALLDLPMKQWPAFALKISPRLFEPNRAELKAGLSPLGALIYELLGHPLSARGIAASTRVPGLGETGNAVLVRGSASTSDAFGGNLAFVEALVQAAVTQG